MKKLVIAAIAVSSFGLMSFDHRDCFAEADAAVRAAQLATGAYGLSPSAGLLETIWDDAWTNCAQATTNYIPPADK